MAPPTFADVLPVKQLSSHKYALTLEDEWCIGTGKWSHTFIGLKHR